MSLICTKSFSYLGLRLLTFSEIDVNNISTQFVQRHVSHEQTHPLKFHIYNIFNILLLYLQVFPLYIYEKKVESVYLLSLKTFSININQNSNLRSLCLFNISEIYKNLSNDKFTWQVHYNNIEFYDSLCFLKWNVNFEEFSISSYKQRL